MFFNSQSLILCKSSKYAMNHSRDKCKPPILIPNIAQFTIKRTFHEKHIVAMFFYFKGLTLCEFSNKSNKQFQRKVSEPSAGQK